MGWRWLPSLKEFSNIVVERLVGSLIISIKI